MNEVDRQVAELQAAIRYNKPKQEYSVEVESDEIAPDATEENDD